MTRIADVVLLVALSASCKFPPPPDVPDDDGDRDAATDGPAGCLVDTDCDSDLCDHGTCASVGTVLFVRPDGSDGGSSCSDRANPCQTITHALLNVPVIADDPVANRRYIKLMVRGEYADPAAVTISNKAVVIVGAPVDGFDRSVIDRLGRGVGMIVDSRSTVRLERVGVYSANGDATAHGISCTDAALTADGVEILSSDGFGVNADTCDLVLRNSVVSGNHRGGVLVTGAGRAAIVNNSIESNGGNTLSEFGGIQIDLAVSATSVVQSNTVVGNHSIDADGIVCSVPGLVLRNNIVFGSATKHRVSGNCTFDHTLYGPDDRDSRLGFSSGNMLVGNFGELQFAGAGARDYHILPTSVAKGKGTTIGLATEAMTDIDGQPRPQGAPDVGADEIPD